MNYFVNDKIFQKTSSILTEKSLSLIYDKYGQQLYEKTPNVMNYLQCKKSGFQTIILKDDSKLVPTKNKNDKFNTDFINYNSLEMNKKEVDEGVVSFAKDKIKNFIIDTDLDADCDDVGAIAIADILSKRKFGKILAITHCVGYKEALQNVAIVNKYYNINIPLGLFNGDKVVPFSDKYVTSLNKKFPCDFDYSDSIRLLRKQLANSEDKSVTLITLGQFNNVEKLRISLPDDLSPLNGQDLMEQKIEKIVSMGGMFLENKDDYKNNYDGREYNIISAISPARSFVSNMKTIPFIFVDWFCGYDVITFQEYVNEFKDKKPVSYSYYLFSKGGRESWDLITTMYAFMPKSKAFRLVGPGKVNISEDGTTTFDFNNNCNHYYLRINNKQYVKNYLDSLIYEGEKYAKKIN